MRFKIDWASLIGGRKFTVFALFYFVFEGNFPSTSPRGTYIWRGNLTEGFLRYRFGGLIFGGAYFRNFTVISIRKQNGSVSKQGQPGRLKFPWLVYYKPTAVIGLLSSFSVCCFYLQVGFIFDA